jgi:hypothetical protein
VTEACFVASPGRPAELVGPLTDAIALANQRNPLGFQLWIENDIAGRPLIAPIHESIRNSPIFIADITYLNLNVTYEIGYAIGRSKRVLLTRNTTLKGDFDLADSIGIFDTLGYRSWNSAHDLSVFLTSDPDQSPIPLDYPLNSVNRVYFLDIPGTLDAIRHIVSGIKRVFRLYRSFSDEESVRLSASSAIENVASSSGVIMPYLSSQYRFAEIHNYRAMFVAGLAHGMERPTLILKSADMQVPLDIRDFSNDYKTDS